MTWTDECDSEDGYEIERSLVASSDFEQIGTTESDAEEYIDAAGLEAGTTYYYRIRAYDTTGYSEYTATEIVTTGSPAFAGFAPSLSEGVFWDFRWKTGYSSQGYIGELNRGGLHVSLGASTEIAGITGYAVEYAGSFAEFMDMPWQYMAVDGNRLLGSTDGAGWDTLFDGDLGYWAGGGFFSEKPDDMISSASGGTISGIDYVGGTGLVVGASSSSTDCTSAGGITVCGGGGYEGYSKYEYFQEGIGPVGYRFYYSEFSWDWSYQAEDEIGLIASSLAGDEAVLIPEAETGEYPDGAQIVASGTIILGDIHVDDTTVSITTRTDDPLARSLSPHNAGRGAPVPGVPNPEGIQVHDTFIVELAAGSSTCTVQLIFVGDPEETEIALYALADFGSYRTYADLANTPVWSDLTVEFEQSADETCLIAVRADTTAERIPYMLIIDPED